VPPGMTPMNTLLYWCLHFGKTSVRAPLAVMAASMRHAWLMRLLGPLLDAGVPAADRRLATDPEYEPRMAAVPDAFRQGTSAAAAELVMLRKAWDIDLADISSDVHVWHGRHDANVPFALGEALSRQIPGATTHFIDDSAHSVGFVHRDAVMELIATTVESTLTSGGPSA
jgi:pimeloyl-ACP methyl ester carboxylesterase